MYVQSDVPVEDAAGNRLWAIEADSGELQGIITLHTLGHPDLPKYVGM